MGKKSSKTTNKTVYGSTSTSNPYVTSQTNNKGTVSIFNPGTAYDSINKFVNSNMQDMLNEYLNPSLNSITNKSKMNNFINNLNNKTTQNLENNIINPLSNRNMIRSSQATNMYNNLAQSNAAEIANYTNELLANSQSNSAEMLSNLLLWYMNGYNTISDTQNQSLATSQGNAQKTETTNSSSNLDMSPLVQLAMQIALKSAGL